MTRFFHVQVLSIIGLLSHQKNIGKEAQFRKYSGQRQKFQIRRTINFPDNCCITILTGITAKINVNSLFHNVEKWPNIL